MDVKILGEITDLEVIARGISVRVRNRLSKAYGPGRWRKLRGVAAVRLPDDLIVRAEVHWYEAHGIGRKELKIKRLLESMHD
jgi:hypothetical protein